MAQVLTWDWRTRAATGSLTRAFVLSLALHALAFATIESGHRLEFWRLSPLAMLAEWLRPDFKAVALEAARQDHTLPPREQPREEVPVIFVDVDPSQASEEEPEQTKYYAAVTSRAGNPDTSQDSGQARLDGIQDLVPKTLDTERAPAPPTAAAAPQPLQPAPTSAEARAPEPPREIATKPPSPEPPRPVVEEPRESPSRPGDLAMARPRAEPQPEPRASAPAPEEAAEPALRPRPRTVAAARAQMSQNPQSALEGRKMMQEGGVRRFSVVVSVDARGTPLGAYDARFVEAVQQCWYALLEEQRYSLDRLGRVVITFRLTAEGRITDMRVEESNVGEIYTTLCQLAITKPAPYEKWPPDVRRLVGNDYRDIRFTFYY